MSLHSQSGLIEMQAQPADQSQPASPVDSVVLTLHEEIRRSAEARYDHRLHAVLLVSQGMTMGEAAYWLGEAPRSIEYWIRKYRETGVAGLQEGERTGRPHRLSTQQLEDLLAGLAHPRPEGPRSFWTGQQLSAWIKREYGLNLSVRQCQRLLRAWRKNRRDATGDP